MYPLARPNVNHSGLKKKERKMTKQTILCLFFLFRVQIYKHLCLLALDTTLKAVLPLKGNQV